MKNTCTNVLLLLLFTIYTTGCKKDLAKNATLPPATQEGKNTVGFTVNGEVWVPYAKCESFSNPCREISAHYGASGGHRLMELTLVLQEPEEANLHI